MNRNGSGAYDGTAYKAMMGAPKPGEIWMHRNGSVEREVLIIQNHGTVCTILTLVDEAKDNRSVQVEGRSLKWVTPYMLQYAFNQSFGELVKKLSDEDFDSVLDAVEDALDLNIYRADAKEALEASEHRIKELEAQLAKAKTAAPAESIYKRLYDDLIDRLIEKKVM